MHREVLTTVRALDSIEVLHRMYPSIPRTKEEAETETDGQFKPQQNHTWFPIISFILRLCYKKSNLILVQMLTRTSLRRP